MDESLNLCCWKTIENSQINFYNDIMDLEYFKKRLEETRQLYNLKKSINNPFLKSEVILNSDGFHHLQFSARRERNKEEQLLKFNLLPLAFHVIKNSGTLQEYRKELVMIGKKSTREGLRPTKMVDYWGFIAIMGSSSQIKIKVVLRKIGDGNIIFWSVMPYTKLKGGQKLFTDNIEDE